jgi:Cd2+/Zn2+-exporting ATPase
LVISTPVSIVSALTTAARHGVLVKGGRFLELAATLKTVALDKTGTLTVGKPVVQRIVPFNGHSAEELLERAAAMEQHSGHPIAQAVINYVESQDLGFRAAADVQVLGGRGAEGTFDGRRFWIGSHRFMHEQGTETDEIHVAAIDLEDAGHTVAAVGNDEHVCGLISVADEVREGIAQTIDDLRAVGVEHIVLLTGDNKQTAQAIAKVAGVDEFHADLLPADKVTHIEQLLARCDSVAMVGDGINDAPAMAISTLGIAMGAIGTDTAIETADVALMTDDLNRIPWLIRHARRTLATIKQNITFALTLKAAFVVLTLFGVASLWLAIAADTGASLLVIANGLRLLRSK